MKRSPAAQALIDCLKRIEAERNALKEALQKIRNQPNCRHEIEAQLGEEIWDVIEFEIPKKSKPKEKMLDQSKRIKELEDMLSSREEDKRGSRALAS